VVAVPLLVVLILLTTNRKVMGEFTSSRLSTVLAWATVAIMAAAVIAMCLPMG
jgi:Mn2+/Fe2+ NRAMP family transporter